MHNKLQHDNMWMGMDLWTTLYFLNTLKAGVRYIRTSISAWNSSCQLPTNASSFADCTRELFKGSNGSDSLLDCIRKKFFWLGLAEFLWVTS